MKTQAMAHVDHTDRTIVLTGLTVLIVILGMALYSYYESTLPPLTNSQLAQRLRHKSEDYLSPWGGRVTASCQTTSDRMTRVCNVSTLSSWCLTRSSTPRRVQLVVKVDGQDYAVTRQDVDLGHCEDNPIYALP
jgi:hypothetical protein